METLSFPGLGFSLNLNRVAFTIFGREIYWYGILFGIAFIVAVLYIIKRVREFGLDADRMIDVLLGSVIGGIIGARLYYAAFSGETYTLTRLLNIREGGLALYGGVIGALLILALMCKIRKVRILPICDLFAGALLIAQAIGRWGNFVNIEAFGSNTTLPWGMTSPSIVHYLTAYQANLAAIGVNVDPNMPVHPTFLYESLWCLVGFIFLALYIKHRKFDGEVTLIYLFWYGLGRAWIESLRTDSLMVGSLRVSQLVAIFCVATCAVLWILTRRKVAANPDHVLYVDSEEGQAVLDGTFYKKRKADAEQAALAEAAESEPKEDTASEPAAEGALAGAEGDNAAAEEQPGDDDA